MSFPRMSSYRHNHLLHHIEAEFARTCSRCHKRFQDIHSCPYCQYNECARCFFAGNSCDAPTQIALHQHPLTLTTWQSDDHSFCTICRVPTHQLYSCMICSYDECQQCNEKDKIMSASMINLLHQQLSTSLFIRHSHLLHHVINNHRQRLCNLCHSHMNEYHYCPACNYIECNTCFLRSSSIDVQLQYHKHLHHPADPPFWEGMKPMERLVMGFMQQCSICHAEYPPSYVFTCWGKRGCRHVECERCHLAANGTATISEHSISQSQRPRFDSLNIINYAELNFHGGQVLGEGGFGQVRSAKYRGRSVAVKVLRADVSQMFGQFEREAQAMAIRHPNIVELIGVTTNPQSLVAERMAGSLNRLIRQCILTVKQKRRICTDIISALTYLHSRNVIHRDVKPANVLISCDGTMAKIADFGLAKIIESHMSLQRRYHLLQTICGTEHHMAPEIMTGQYNEKVDVYALGILMKDLFGVDQLNNDEKNIIDNCIQTNPNQRPTMNELEQLLLYWR